jgi:hypothetical protein
MLLMCHTCLYVWEQSHPDGRRSLGMVITWNLELQHAAQDNSLCGVGSSAGLSGYQAESLGNGVFGVVYECANWKRGCGI